MARARTNHSAVRLADGRVLVSGGRDGSDVLGSTEIFDPGSGTWSSGPPLITPRYGHSSVLLSTGVVAVMNGSPNRLTSVELLW